MNKKRQCSKFLIVSIFLLALSFSASAAEDNITVKAPDNSTNATGDIDLLGAVENDTNIGLRTALWYSPEPNLQNQPVENVTFNQTNFNTSYYHDPDGTPGSYNLSDGTYNITFRTYNNSSSEPDGELNYTNVEVDNKPNINPVSITENDSVANATLDIGAVVNDPNNDDTGFYKYRWLQNGNSVTKRKDFNDTFKATNLPGDGKYNLTFEAQESWTGEIVTKKVENVTVDVPLTVNDNNQSTTTSYPTPLTFIGETLTLSNTNKKNQFNLTNSTGTVINSVIDTLSLGTSSAETDRHTVNNTNTTSTISNTTIDVFSTANDVVGRINSINNVNVDVLYWLNGSNATGSDQFNVSGVNQWPDNMGVETAYRMNKSKDEYWLRVQTDRQTKVAASRGVSTFLSQGVSSPRANDFNLGTPSNITGNVTLNSTGNAVSGLKLRLKRKVTKYSLSRIPYFSGPPEMTNFTNSSGGYKFSGLQTGKQTSYMIEVVNYSYTTKDHPSPFESPGIKLNQSGVEKTYDFDVTNRTGNITVDMVGQNGKNTRFGFLLQNGSTGYIKTGVSPDQNAKISVENKSYDLIAGKFNLTNSSDPTIVTESDTVKAQTDSEVGPIEIGFPATVKLNGTIQDSSSNAVENANVIVKNESERKFFTDRTDSNGEYSLQVENDSNYTLKIRAPFGSTLGSNETNITVIGDTTKDRSLSEGPFINGTITDGSGNPVEGAEVDAWNGSVDSYGTSETDSNGEYKVGGLQKDTNYSLFVSPPEDSSLPFDETSVNLSGDNATKDVTLSTQKYNLTVNVTNASANQLDANVKLRGSTSDEKDISGNTTFEDLESGFYSVRVAPDNSSYRDSRKSVFLESNTELDFNLTVFKGLSGTVQNESNTNDGVSNAYVYAYNYSERSFGSTRTDSSGNYQLDLSEVDHEVDIYPPGDSSFQSNSTSISASTVGGTRNFNLSTGETLSGEVKDKNGNSLSGFISIFNTTQNSYGFTEFSGGSYSINGLQNISYNAYISVDDSSFNSRTFNVGKSNFTNGRNFTFGSNKGPKVRVEVTDSNDVPVANATVQLGGEQQKTDSEGETVFGKLTQKESTVSIGVYKDNYNSSSKTVTVKKEVSSGFGEKSSINTWNESFTLKNIQGDLKEFDVNVTKNGQNVSSATVVAAANKSASFRSSSDITDSNGIATLEQINPGDYLVTVVDGTTLNSDNITLNDTNVGNTYTLDSSNYKVGLEGSQ